MTTLAGVGSGLDLETMIRNFVNIEAQTRTTPINRRETRLEEEISGVGSFKSALSTFRTTLKKLADIDNFAKFTATTTYSAGGTSQPLSATIGASAVNGNYDVTVQSLAASTRLKSAALTGVTPSTTAVGEGTLTFNGGVGNSFTVDVEAGDTLNDVVAKVNANSDNFGVSATIINSDAGPVLVFESSKTGLANALTVTTDDSSLDALSTDLLTNRSAANAVITVNGETVTSTSNTVSNAVTGVTLNLASTTAVGEKVTLNVASDKESAKKLVQEFVDGFNKMADQLDKLGNPKTGLLASDSGVRTAKSAMASALAQSVTGVGQFSSLYELGVELDRGGRLTLNANKLDKALSTDMADVGAVFADSSKGIAKKLLTTVEGYVGADGSLLDRENNLVKQRGDIKNARDRLDKYLEDYESTLRKQYTALDATMAKYTATASYLDGVFKSLSSSSKK